MKLLKKKVPALFLILLVVLSLTVPEWKSRHR